MAPPVDPNHALDPETIALGKQQLAKLRAELGLPTKRVRSQDEPVARQQPDDAPQDAQVEPASVDHDDGYTDRLVAGMTAAAERDRLEARIAQLETEVAQLRDALAAILRTAAGAVAAADTSHASRADD